MLHCRACKLVKPKSEFYESNQARCKECVKSRAKENRLLRIDHYRAYDRKRGNRQAPEYLKDYRENNRFKYIAHNKVNNSLRDGKIKRMPCEICGSEKSVAHHDDYSKPLAVRWLCQAHHKQWHAKHGEAKNGSDEITKAG